MENKGKNLLDNLWEEDEMIDLYNTYKDKANIPEEQSYEKLKMESKLLDIKAILDRLQEFKRKKLNKLEGNNVLEEQTNEKSQIEAELEEIKLIMKQLQEYNSKIIEELGGNKGLEEPTEIIKVKHIIKRLQEFITKREEDLERYEVDQPHVEIKKRFVSLPKGMSPDLGPNTNLKASTSTTITQNVQHWPTLDMEKVSIGNKIENLNIIMKNEEIKIDLSKLKKSQFIGHIDKKFILLQLEGMLLAVDQHAADERIQYNRLLKEYSNKNKWKTFKLPQPITISNKCFLNEHLIWLRTNPQKLNYLGIHFSYNEEKMIIKTVPLCLYEHANNEFHLQNLCKFSIFEAYNKFKDFIPDNSELEKLPILMNVISQMACKKAIKFGDSMSKEDSINLIKKLSQCPLASQCAHGRPTIIPLFDE